MKRGYATFTLDTGICPRWLFERMVRLCREMVRVVVSEYGSDEFVKRIADPVWFQTLGTVAAFDWNASGLTTILTAALKEAIRGEEKELGVFIAGGKGKTSRKAPEEIQRGGSELGFEEERTNALVYNSRMAAKVDSSLVQDGYQIYHHAFFFSRNGEWAVVQQGMNTATETARRYHWYSNTIKDMVCEPHAGIAAMAKARTLDLTAEKSVETRAVSIELVGGGYRTLMKDVMLLRRHSSPVHQTLALRFQGEENVFLNLENAEFKHHAVEIENMSESAYLKKILSLVCESRPKDYEKLAAFPGVGAKTLRALALVAEVIYGADPSYEDPARYSFAHGGKDGTPYPIDRKTYDETITMMRNIVAKTKLEHSEKKRMVANIARKT